jgi:1,4-dihydroxy-2-naphthoate octaprenyltransferase
MACRPATLTAASAPVLVGSAVAFREDQLKPDAAAAALLGALLLQVGSNLANDAFDFEKGSDTHERLGPPRAAQMGLLTPAQLRQGMWVVFALATLVGVYLTWIAGPAVVAIGLISIVSAIAYTAGPFPLGYNGLGDVFVLIFFGFMAVCGTTFVQAGSILPLAWWAALPIGALATTILVVNNVRDLPTDVKSGKRTLPVRFGRAAGVAEYALLLAVAYGVPLLLWLQSEMGPLVALPLATLPISLALFQKLRANSGRALNAVLVASARVLFVFGVLFAIGIVIA